MTIALKESLARTAAATRLYADFTVSDSAHANPRLLASASDFIATNAWGGPPVYPVVLSWGGLDKGDIGGSATITFAANAKWVPANSIENLTVAQWFRELNLADVAISIYQWTEEAASAAVIWAGYISHVEMLRTENGVALIDLVLSASSSDVQLTPTSDLINRTDFPAAPLTSVGKMSPIHYGDLPNRITGSSVRNSIGMIGHPMMGAKGIVIAENTAAQSVTLRMMKNDGVSAAKLFAEPASDNAIFDANNAPLEGDLWIYDPSIGAYGMLDAASYSIANDSGKLNCDVSLGPRIYFFIRPSVVGSTVASGFAASIGKLSNSDVNDYVESTASDYIWSFNCPEFPFRGTVRQVRVMVDVANAHATKLRQIKFGLYDIFGGAGAQYLNNLSTTPASLAALGSRRLLGQNTALYIGHDFQFHTIVAGTAQRTDAEFRSGRFVTRDGNQDATLELRCEVNDLGGGDSGRDGVRLYHIIMVVEVEYPKIPTSNAIPWIFRTPSHNYDPVVDKWLGELKDWQPKDVAIQNRFSTFRGTDFFGTGSYAKDDGAGTYTGSANQVIEKPSEIAHHLLTKYQGKTVNALAGTLGNFVDARSSPVMALTTQFSFGPDPIKRGEAIDALNRMTPMDVFEEDKVRYCIPNDMNPHASRLYRSSSEIVKIGPGDIERDSFQCEGLRPQDVVNSVIVNHSHGYPDREAGMTTTYEQRLSQMYFGKKATATIDAPFLVSKQYDTGPGNSAAVYAQWQGRRLARPLLALSMKLTQKFFDLRRGHIVQLAGLEALGLNCPAFRCGLLDYYFNTAVDPVNQADSMTPAFVKVGSTSQIWLGFSQQIAELWAYVAVGAAYTTVSNSWKYSNTTGTMTTVTDALTTNKDGLKSTGLQKIGFVRPDPTAWGKQEISFGTFGVAGPCYWLSMDYVGAGTAGAGSSRTIYPALWDGRLFEVRKASRVPSGQGDYMAMGVSLREVM